jgi:multidrug efflux system outer membrane protein
MRRASVLLLGALSGCNFAPQYREPVAPVSATYPVLTAPRGPSPPLATELGWRDFFLDPRLRALIALGLERNRDLAESYARIDQARAQYRIQESERLPTLETNASATRSRQPLGVGSALPDDGSLTPGIKFSQYTANVGISAFELDLWGRVRNLTEAQRQRYLSSIEGTRAFRLSLIAQIASTYFTIRGGEERIRLAEHSIEGRREGVRIAALRLDAGVTSTVDHDQAVLLLTQAQTELADIQRTTEQTRNFLEVLIGGPPDTPLPPNAPPGEQVRTVDPGLPSALLRNRPDILQAEHELRAANADIGAARAAFFPTISLTGAFGFTSAALGNLTQSGSESWSFGGALNLPIFDWGRRQAQVQLNEAQAAELTAAYQRTVQGAFQEVSDALIGRRRYAEQIDSQIRTLQAQQRLARTARLRYDNGIAIYLEVLDAERNLFSAGQQLIQLRAAELQNAVSLYTALGGGLTEQAGDAGGSVGNGF